MQGERVCILTSGKWKNGGVFGLTDLQCEEENAAREKVASELHFEC